MDALVWLRIALLFLLSGDSRSQRDQNRFDNSDSDGRSQQRWSGREARCCGQDRQDDQCGCEPASGPCHPDPVPTHHCSIVLWLLGEIG